MRYDNFMIVYGGYRGRPLSDMWVLDTGKKQKHKQRCLDASLAFGGGNLPFGRHCAYTHLFLQSLCDGRASRRRRAPTVASIPVSALAMRLSSLETRCGCLGALQRPTRVGAGGLVTCAATRVNLLVVGSGETENHKCVNDLWVFDLGTHESPACAVVRLCVVCVCVCVLLVPRSGRLKQGIPRAGLKKWEEIITAGSLPSPRYGHTAVAFGTSILLFGGADRSYGEHSHRLTFSRGRSLKDFVAKATFLSPDPSAFMTCGASTRPTTVGLALVYAHLCVLLVGYASSSF